MSINQNKSIPYESLEKIVWAFADVIRNQGRGTVEDYAKIILPTCLVKRVLDIQAESVQDKKSELMGLVQSGIYNEDQAVDQIGKAYPFFDMQKVRSSAASGALFVTWNDLINFEDNPNGELRLVGNALFGKPLETNAKNFVSLMFELSDCFAPIIRYVFKEFEFENLVLHKKILPYAAYANTCRVELSPSFSLSAVSTDLFSDMYMNLIERFATDAGKSGGEFFTPHSLAEQAIAFADLGALAKDLATGKRSHLNIADPTSGSNTFLNIAYDQIRRTAKEKEGYVCSDKAFRFFAQELKAFQYCLGAMNMLFHGTSEMYNQGISRDDQNSNVIENYANGIGQKRGQMDLVIANPPYGIKDYGIAYAQATKNTDPRWRFGVPQASEGELAFLMTICDLLNQNGKAIVVMPLGTLFRDAGRTFRENLIKEDVLEGIVTLPGNMFMTTSIPVCLWILNKNKSEADKGKVFLVNASEDFKKVGKFNEWQHAHAQANYLSRTQEEGFCGYVSFEVLEKNAYNLSVQRYFSKAEARENVDLVALSKEIKQLELEIAKDKVVMDDVFAQILNLEGLSLDCDNA